MMVVYYDTKDDVVTIALRGGVGPGEIHSTATVCDRAVQLHFNAAGQLIAIELYDMDMLHPDLARDAIQMWPVQDGDL
jgi:hypothetical protein